MGDLAGKPPGLPDGLKIAERGRHRHLLSAADF
jgi:hypothetical protein